MWPRSSPQRRDFRSLAAVYCLQCKVSCNDLVGRSKGTIKEQHPEALAQAFLGMFFAYAISLNVLDEAIKPVLSNSQLVSQFVDIFVTGTLKGK